MRKLNENYLEEAWRLRKADVERRLSRARK